LLLTLSRRAALFALVILAGGAAAADFVATGSMTSPRWLPTSTALPSGKALVAGGGSGFNLPDILATAEVYDPASGSFSTTGSMTVGRRLHVATLLGDGKVLITGGQDSTGAILASAEIYDPATGAFTATGGMSQPRLRHTATLLPDGRVLVAGGVSGPTTASAELYDPATGSFTVTGSMSTPRYGHIAARLASGEVLIAGGSAGGGAPDALASAELFDPAAGVFTPTGSMTTPRWFLAGAPLADGGVLVSGGMDTSGTQLASAEVYDRAAGGFSPTGSMTAPWRSDHVATALPDGKVLVTGGINGTNAAADLYDPALGTFAAIGNMTMPRLNHTVSLLASGRALIAGGFNINPVGQALASAELYPAPPPVADAGPDQNVLQGQTVTLSGAGSTDPAGGTLIYSWTLATKPAGSAAVLSSASGVTTSFVADAVGQYVISLVVSNGTQSSAAETVVVDASAAPSAGLTIDVARAVVDFGKHGKADDKVDLKIDFAFSGLPSGTIRVVFDGVTLLEAPFAQFVRTRPGKYHHHARNLRAEIDLRKGTLELSRDKVRLSGIDARNGVDVQVAFGAAVDSDHFRMHRVGNGHPTILFFKERHHRRDHDG
jgi:hypothetical protein